MLSGTEDALYSGIMCTAIVDTLAGMSTVWTTMETTHGVRSLSLSLPHTSRMS